MPQKFFVHSSFLGYNQHSYAKLPGCTVGWIVKRGEHMLLMLFFLTVFISVGQP